MNPSRVICHRSLSKSLFPVRRILPSRLYSSTVTATVPEAPTSPSQSQRMSLTSLVLSAAVGAAAGAATYRAFIPSIETPRLDTYLSQPLALEEASQSKLMLERDSLPIVVSLRSNPLYKEVEAYSWLKGSALQHSLTATTLSGHSKISLRPIQFYTANREECIAIMHLGRSICGHDGIVHGGLLGTLMDEMLAVVAIPALPKRTGFTANLNINYRAPVRANQFVMTTSRLQRVEGRKAFAEAKITSIDGTITFVEATALFVSPKYDMPSTRPKADEKE